ncbi:3-dehydroquinate synthase [uncultured Salipiger sp.]|uniref:3-dehydroquinate synthase n=1 Tax=uncultured Salipiger sp. TaxID=499810 RepID=UPI002598F66F|nr:3-dehydroquinate synthase [uncultured Salipiger sp.]
MRWGLLFVLLVTAVSLPFVLFEDEVDQFAARAVEAASGAPQLAVMIGAALTFDVILPVPSSIVNAVAGAMLGFLLGALVCWGGMTLGCLFGYWIGATGGTALVRRLMGEGELARAETLAGRMGAPALVVLRAVPVLAEASTIAAGAARYPLGRFMAVTGFANIGIAMAYAGVGAYALSTNSFLLAVGGAIAIPTLGYGLHRATAGWTGVTEQPASAAAPAETETPAFSIDYRYPVIFTRGLFDVTNPVLANTLHADAGGAAKCVFVLDAGVVGAMPVLPRQIEAYCTTHPGALTLLAPPVTLPGGEAIKSGFDVIQDLYRLFLKHGVDRHAYVIAIGGGAVLDAVGFAAATAHRGLRHVRVPTTVLGQNDSGVGVKNAVNFDGIKNYAGTFAPPRAVLNDFLMLDALPRRDRVAGASEAVKVALIRDGAFFRWIEDNSGALANFEPEAEEHMIRRSAALHIRQIAQGGDPFETGSARPLDFGHWAAHRLETLSGHALRHGEAVAIGIALDTRYSVLAGLLPEGEDARVVRLLETLGLPVWHDALDQTDAEGARAVISGLREFQEHLGGALTITLLREIGVGVEVHEMDHALVAEAIDWLRARRQGA